MPNFFRSVFNQFTIFLKGEINVDSDCDCALQRMIRFVFFIRDVSQFLMMFGDFECYWRLQ